MAYLITNSFDIKDDLKEVGGKFDKELKGWVISKEAFDKINARTSSYGMSWAKGWAKAHKEDLSKSSIDGENGNDVVSA